LARAKISSREEVVLPAEQAPPRLAILLRVQKISVRAGVLFPRDGRPDEKV